jgi:hypothetical protein
MLFIKFNYIHKNVRYKYFYCSLVIDRVNTFIYYKKILDEFQIPVNGHDLNAPVTK